MGPRLRLALLVGTLTAVGLTIVVWRPVDEDGLRDLLDPLGVAAPLGFVVLAAVLGALFVPGPLLAGASGLLFGTAIGFFATLAAAILGGVLAVTVGRSAGREPAAELEGERLAALTALARRRGIAAVAVQRLIPAVPDAPCSYAFGLAGVRWWQVAAGTAIGSAPRSLSYTAIGDSLGTGNTAQALAATGLLVAAGAVGLVLAALVVRRHASSGRMEG